MTTQDSLASEELDWEGWQHGEFALEVQEEWSNLLLSGVKTMEVRQYRLPPSLLGKRVWILESKTGRAGVSSLGNSVKLNEAAKIIGSVVFDALHEYKNASDFARDEQRHRISSTSSYAWKTGNTELLYGWHVKHATSNDSKAEIYEKAERRMRSLFQLL